FKCDWSSDVCSSDLAFDLGGLAGLDDAELRCLLDGHPDRRNSDTGAGFDVAVEHLPRVHAIDVVGSEDEDVGRLFVVDDVEVLRSEERRGGKARGGG